MISEKTIERIIRYRRILKEVGPEHRTHIFSHQLAEMAHCNAAQVRRDLMLLGIAGSPAKGYLIGDIIGDISGFLDGEAEQRASLCGIGNLGRAILAYFVKSSPNIKLAAAFDRNPAKTNQTLFGCRTYPVDRFSEIVKKRGISIGIITVPAESAQQIADMMTTSGIKGIINFAPTLLKVPSWVCIEQLDVNMYLEKVAYFARQSNEKQRPMQNKRSIRRMR